MAEPVRHRQTKEAATDMFCLTPPRHISTLPFASVWWCTDDFRSTPKNRHCHRPSACPNVPTRRPSCAVQMKETGRVQLKRLRNFLRISLRSPAYSSTIRRASCVREGLLGGSGPEVGSSSSVRRSACGRYWRISCRQSRLGQRSAYTGREKAGPWSRSFPQGRRKAGTRADRDRLVHRGSVSALADQGAGKMISPARTIR